MSSEPIGGSSDIDVTGAAVSRFPAALDYQALFTGGFGGGGGEGSGPSSLGFEVALAFMPHDLPADDAAAPGRAAETVLGGRYGSYGSGAAPGPGETLVHALGSSVSDAAFGTDVALAHEAGLPPVLDTFLHALHITLA